MAITENLQGPRAGSIDASGSRTVKRNFTVTGTDNLQTAIAEMDAEIGYLATYEVGTDVVSGGVAASTWIKLGFGYFPNHPDGGRVVFSVDGTILDDVVSESFGSTFPDGDYLTPIFGIRNDSGSAAKQLDIDWWAFYQSSDLE